MIRTSLITLALIGVAGIASAQQVISSPPQPSPGDYQREAPGLQPPTSPQLAEAPSSYGCGHRASMRDEYGFRYDERGDRLNRRGCVISPQTKTP